MPDRRQLISSLLDRHAVTSQPQLVELLAGHGVHVTQATVSRDISQLGLVKVRNAEGRLVYALPGAADLRRLDELASALRHYMGMTTASGTMLVIQTPRGFAAALADAIDAAALPEVAGTIAGDNTVFIACTDGTTPAELDAELRSRL